MQHQVTWHQKCPYRVTFNPWALKASENVFTWASVCISWVAFVTSLIAIRQTSPLFLSECYVKHQYGVFITGEASSEKNKLTRNVWQTNRRRQRKKKNLLMPEWEKFQCILGDFNKVRWSWRWGAVPFFFFFPIFNLLLAFPETHATVAFFIFTYIAPAFWPNIFCL